MALTKIRGSTQVLDLSVTNSQIANKDAANPDGILLSKIQNGNLLVTSDGAVPFTAPIAGVTPTQASHLATKGYVDSTAQGLDVKLSVRAVATTNAVLSGTQTIDGVSLSVGDRVLLTGQTSNVANGIYVVAAGGWSRAPDATTNSEVTPGMFTFVEEGTNYNGTGWVLTSTGPTTLGTTPLPFAQFSQAGVIQAGNGLSKSGTTLSVVSSNGGIVSSSSGIALTLDGSTLSVSSAGLKLANAATGSFLIAAADGSFTPHVLSGDVSVSSAGVVTINDNAVRGSSIMDHSLSLTKFAASATPGSIVLTGADNYPVYVVQTGDVTISTAGVTTIGAAAVTTSKLADASVTLTKLAPIPAGKILIGTAAGNASVTLSGDVVVSEAGVVSVNPATVVRVADIVKRETPTGSINGVNDTFVLASTPKTGTVDVYVNGILQDEGTGNDYTISAATITTLYKLTPGDKIRVNYFK
jgi:hypothetical protein